jgi:hypothetical protein
MFQVFNYSEESSPACETRGIKWVLSRFRPLPDKLCIKKEILFSACVTAAGAGIGVAAKAADSVSLIGDVGTDLAVWVFLASLIAAYSRHPVSAAVNVLLVFAAVLGGYYIYSKAVLGLFPRAYFLGWLIVTLLSPIGGLIVWFARGEGLEGAVITALPAGILAAWSYPAFYTRSIVLILGLVEAVALCALLPRGWKMKLAALGMSAAAAVLIEALGLLRLLPF